MIALPKHLQELVVDLSNSDFKLLAGAMHGASISGGCKKENNYSNDLSTTCQI